MRASPPETFFAVLRLDGLIPAATATATFSLPREFASFGITEIQCADADGYWLTRAAIGELEVLLFSSLVEVRGKRGDPCPLGAILGKAQLPPVIFGQNIHVELANLGDVDARATDLVIGGLVQRRQN